MFRWAELTSTVNRARRAAPIPPYPVVDALLDYVHSLTPSYALFLPPILKAREVVCEPSGPAGLLHPSLLRG